MTIVLKVILALLLPRTFLAACCTIGAVLTMAGRRRGPSRSAGSVLIGTDVADLPQNIACLR